MRKALFTILRVLISLLLLGGLLYFIGPGKIVQNLKGIHYSLFGLAISIFVIALLFFTLRWLILLKYSNNSPGYGRLLVIYFIGYFFNNFLPTAIGGDVGRAYYVSKLSGDRAAGIGSVLFERILGVLSTLTLASVSMVWAIGYLADTVFYMFGALFLIVVFSLVNLLNPSLFNFTHHLLSKIKILSIGERINKVLSSIHSLRESKSTILYGYLVSVFCQILLIIMNLVLAKSLGLTEITLGHLFLVIPATFVMGLLPSLNGLGVRESGYVIFLSQIFQVASPDEAVSLSLLNTFVPVLVSLVGGVALIFYRHDVGKPAMDDLNAPLE